jgi:hypothetical protein
VCCVLFERGALFCVMCIFVLCVIVVPLPPGKNPFVVQIIIIIIIIIKEISQHLPELQNHIADVI